MEYRLINESAKRAPQTKEKNMKIQKQEKFEVRGGKPTKSGVVAALMEQGYETMPFALRGISPAPFTKEEWDWSRYLIFDNDFGGAWNDAAQINMHLA